MPAWYDPQGMRLFPIGDGDRIPLSFPPQGGFVLFVGARMRGLTDSSVELRTRVLDPATAELVTGDARDIDLVPDPETPGAVIPDLRSYTNVDNITACPLAWSADIRDRPYVLEAEVTEYSTHRVGRSRRTITPTCGAGNDVNHAALCRCLCETGFAPGKCSPG